MYGTRAFPVRAYSAVTHKHYRLRGGYRTGELAIVKYGERSRYSIWISADLTGYGY